MLQTKQEKIDYIRDLKNKGLNDHELKKIIEKTFNVKKSRRNELFREIFSLGGAIKSIEDFGKVFEGLKITTGKDKEVEATLKTTEQIDIDEVIKRCKINTSVYQVKSFAVEEKAKGNFTWRVSFEKNKGYNSKESVEELIEILLENKPDWEQDVEKVIPNGDKCYLVGILDLHLGKLCGPDETRQPYKISIAEDLYRDALIDLMSRIEGQEVDRILFPVGNDLLHVDNSQNTTTAGTKQDVDGRTYKIFQTATALMIESIELMASKYPVDVVIVRSNHDYDSILHVGEVIKAWFKDHPNVTINNEPTARKYYRYGKNLIGFTHGNEEKHSSLPNIMAAEAKEDWAKSDFRYFILGHYHKTETIVSEISCVSTLLMPSLSAADEWHARKGYVGQKRGAMGLLFDKELGLITQHHHNVKG